MAGMKTNSQLFEAYLKCPTKSWLRSRGDTGGVNAYAELVKAQEVAYRIEGVRRLRESLPEGEWVVAPPPRRKSEGSQVAAGGGLFGVRACRFGR